MLGKGKTADMPAGKLNTMIGAGTVFEGTMVACDVTRVDGTFKGEIKSGGTIIIGTEGRVNGNINAMDIMVGGTVEGDIHSDGKVEVSSTGKVYGDIYTKSIIIDEHAVFQGKCCMDEKREQAGGWTDSVLTESVADTAAEA